MFIAQGAPTLRSGGVRCAGWSTTDFGSIVLFAIGHGTPTERDLGGGSLGYKHCTPPE